jgi:uncharacterized protein YbaP (TraB family)
MHGRSKEATEARETLKKAETEVRHLMTLDTACLAKAGEAGLPPEADAALRRSEDRTGLRPAALSKDTPWRSRP